MIYMEKTGKSIKSSCADLRQLPSAAEVVKIDVVMFAKVRNNKIMIKICWKRGETANEQQDTEITGTQMFFSPKNAC